MRYRKLGMFMAALSALALTQTGLAHASIAPVSQASSGLPPFQCSAQHDVRKVTKRGDQFVIGGKPRTFRGFTMYPIGASWNDPTFPSYVTKVLNLARSAGQTLARPTDEWTATGSGQTWNDPVIWSNLDDVVCQAAAHRMHVVMDLSAYKWLLESHGENPLDAQLWLPFLQAVGAHYRGVTAIAEYSIDGEPAFPVDKTQMYTLKAFYRVLTDALYAADPTHLISVGGFNNMNNGYPDWWKPIYALPHDDVAGFKTYSEADLADEASYIQAIHSLHKIALDEEFGEPQYVGDATYTGQPYNRLAISRADFYRDVYSTADANHCSGEIFWNLARLVGPQHYDVSPETPAVWQVVLRYGGK